VKTVIKLAIMFIIGLLIGAGAIYAAIPMLVPAPATPETVEISIGGLFSTTGSMAMYGLEMKTSAEIAIDHVNDYLEKAGSIYRFKLLSVDTGNTAEGALKALTSLVETKGIKAITGPGCSVEVGGIKSYCDANKIVSIAISSSDAYCIPDYIFRPFMTNHLAAPPLARLIWKEGITNLAVIYRDDAFGTSLYDAVKKEFEALGGNVQGVKYMIDLPDYASEVAQLSSIVAGIGDYEHTGVVHIVFETDGVNIYSHARTDPVLTKVRWFGEHDLKSSAFMPPDAPPEIAEFRLTVNETGIYPINPITDVSIKYLEEYKNRTGEYPVSYGPNQYDNTYILCLALLATGGKSGEPLKKIIPDVCASYYGATGSKILDENGDLASTDVGIWRVAKKGGEYYYEFFEYYSATTKSFSPWVEGAFRA
jgi:branched-chain amino acid transport system substrate-binding protein